MKLKFKIDGKPFGWQRAGNNHRTKVHYTQKETRQHEQLVKWAYRKYCGNYHFPKDTPIEIVVYAFYAIPKNTSKAKRAKMIAGEIRPIIKPDWDNIGKLVSDALNGIAYDDDKQVVDGTTRKFYSDHPRTVIFLQKAETKLN